MLLPVWLFLLSAAIFGSLAVLLSLVAQVPQVVRALRTRITDGLSPATIGLSLLGCSQWCAYGIAVLDVAQIANNAVSLLLFMLLTHALVVTGVMRSRHGPALLLGSLALAGVAVLVSPLAAAAVGSTIGLVAKVPQVRVALSGVPLWGLDPWAVVLGALTPALWAAYGLASDTPVVVASSALSAVLSAIIGWRRLPPRRTLWSLSEGRLGPHVARAALPLSSRFPHTELVRAA